MTVATSATVRKREFANSPDPAIFSSSLAVDANPMRPVRRRDCRCPHLRMCLYCRCWRDCCESAYFARSGRGPPATGGPGELREHVLRDGPLHACVGHRLAVDEAL